MNKQWVVFSHENGLIGIYDDYDKAVADYEEQKKEYEEYVDNSGEHDENEDIILAVIDRRFYSYDTKTLIEQDEGQTFWDFKEDRWDNPDLLEDETI